MDFIGIEVAVDNGACTTCTESSSSNCSLGIGKTATLSDAVGVGTIVIGPDEFRHELFNPIKKRVATKAKICLFPILYLHK